MLVQPNSPKVLVSILLAALAAPGQSPVRAGSGDEQEKGQSFALLKGSCFDQRGLSLPGVSVLVTIQPEEGKKRGRRWRTVSDRRGEFAVRLPSGERTFAVTAQKKGFEPAMKSVRFFHDEQQHIVIQMTPVSTS